MIGYIWSIGVNLVVLLITALIFEELSSSFETIAVSLLILIYLSIETFHMTYTSNTGKGLVALDAEFKRIRRLLRETPDEYEAEEKAEAQKAIKKGAIKMTINGVFIFIIFAICVANLLSALG